MTEPTIIRKRAFDVTPYWHGVYCSVGKAQPSTLSIVSRRWSSDGARISFMLDCHLFLSAGPEELIDVVEIEPYVESKELRARFAEEDAVKMAKRPDPEKMALAKKLREEADALEKDTVPYQASPTHRRTK